MRVLFLPESTSASVAILTRDPAGTLVRFTTVPWWHIWKYHQNDGIYASDYFHYSEITISIQRFSLWYYSNDTSVPWRLESPAIRLFVQQPNKNVNGPCYWLLVWGIHSWRVNSSHNGPLMRTYVRSLDDLARCVIIHKSSKRCTNILWQWNSDKRWHQKQWAPLGVRTTATSLRMMGNIHPSPHSQSQSEMLWRITSDNIHRYINLNTAIRAKYSVTLT